MAISLDATYGGLSANSYIASVAGADAIATLLAYLPQIEFQSDAWAEAADEAKIMALMMAAQGIDRQPFIGHRHNTSQRREWPRVETGRVYWNFQQGQTQAPDEIQWAQVAEAARLLSYESAQTSAQAGIIQESIEGHSVTYDKSALNKSSDNLGDVALGILRRAGLVPTGAQSIYISRG